MQSTSKFDTASTYDINRKETLIQPGDELYIRVNSFDNQSYNPFSSDTDNMRLMSGPNITLISYTVNEDGYITLPYLGNVYVKGQTLNNVKEKIEESLKNTIDQPTVTVKFVNKNVAVLGEVRLPGQYVFASEKLNILQAIAMAGDITEYGNRKKVLIIRETGNEKVEKRYIDLTNSDIIKSEDFYVRPNDVIYIEPLKARFWGMSSFPFGLILSSITTFVLVLNYINQ